MAAVATALIVLCPHCFDEIVINVAEINCAIFRHAIYRANYEPIDPHATTL